MEDLKEQRESIRYFAVKGTSSLIRIHTCDISLIFRTLRTKPLLKQIGTSQHSDRCTCFLTTSTIVSFSESITFYNCNADVLHLLFHADIDNAHGKPKPGYQSANIAKQQQVLTYS